MQTFGIAENGRVRDMTPEEIEEHMRKQEPEETGLHDPDG